MQFYTIKVIDAGINVSMYIIVACRIIQNYLLS